MPCGDIKNKKYLTLITGITKLRTVVEALPLLAHAGKLHVLTIIAIRDSTLPGIANIKYKKCTALLQFNCRHNRKVPGAL